MSSRVGPYRLQARLGAGGMGAVYRAQHVESGAVHAVKVLAPGDPEAQLRFRREAEAMARVDGHPHVLRVHATGADAGQTWIAMELAEGGSLADRLRRGPLPPLEAAALVRALADGLAHAHARGVLHRDLKPDNVLFDAAGAPKLADFGLARLHGDRSLTQTGTVLGTAAYMPPEQALGEKGVVDARSDVYGLGAVLFHALTGRPPFLGRAHLHVLTLVLTVAPPRPAQLVASVPAWLDDVCLRALAKEPAARFQDAAALAAALATPRLPATRSARGLAAATLGALVIAAVAVLVAARAAPPPAPERTGAPEVAVGSPPLVEVAVASPPPVTDLAPPSIALIATATVADLADVPDLAPDPTRELRDALGLSEFNVWVDAARLPVPGSGEALRLGRDLRPHNPALSRRVLKWVVTRAPPAVAADAWFELSRTFGGDDDPSGHARKLACHARAAELGHAESAWRLAQAYRDERADLQRAIPLLRRALDAAAARGEGDIHDAALLDLAYLALAADAPVPRHEVEPALRKAAPRLQGAAVVWVLLLVQWGETAGAALALEEVLRRHPADGEVLAAAAVVRTTIDPSSAGDALRGPSDARERVRFAKILWLTSHEAFQRRAAELAREGLGFGDDIVSGHAAVLLASIGRQFPEPGSDLEPLRAALTRAAACPDAALAAQARLALQVMETEGAPPR